MSRSRTRKGGSRLPKLHTVRTFAHFIGKSPQWVREACQDGRILAAQVVGNIWIIAEDTLIVPRGMEGFPGELIDVDLPEDMLVGERKEVPQPDYKKGKGGFFNQKMYNASGILRIAEERGYTQAYIARTCNLSTKTVNRIFNGHKATARVILKLATGLGVDIADILRRDDDY